MGRHSAPDDDEDEGFAGVLVATPDHDVVGGLAGLPYGGRPDPAAALLDLSDGAHVHRADAPGQLVLGADERAAGGEVLPPVEAESVEPDPAEAESVDPGSALVMHDVEVPPTVEAANEPAPTEDADEPAPTEEADEPELTEDADEPELTEDADEPELTEDAWWAGNAAVADQASAYPTPAPELDPGGYVPQFNGAAPVPVFTPYWAADAPPPPDDPGAFAPIDPVTGTPLDDASFLTPDPSALTVTDPLAPSQPVAEPQPAVAQAAPAGPAPGRVGRGQSTAADLRLVRERSDVRARVLAGLIVPFVLYVVVMALIGASGRQYLIFLFIPLILAGVLVGTFLDLGHRHSRDADQPTTSPSLPAP